MRLRPLLSSAVLTALCACGPRTYTVVMNAENNSGQSGTAVLTELSKTKTRVEVDVGASDDARPQLNHIHPNHCGEIGPAKIALTPLAADPKRPTRFVGTSEVELSFDELRKGPYAINAHDARDFSLYTVCGNTDGP